MATLSDEGCSAGGFQDGPEAVTVNPRCPGVVRRSASLPVLVRGSLGGYLLNSAFLLVATAWLASGDPVAAPAAPVIVSAPTSCAGGSCGATYAHGSACCDTCCDPCCKESFLQRFFGRFHRNDCCEPTCNTCTTTHVHAAPCCDACADPCCKPSFLDRLRGMFSRNKCCEPACGCDTCANGSCGAPAYHAAPIHAAPATLAPAPGVMPKAGEAIPAPKDPGQPLPKGDEKGDKTDNVSAPAIDGLQAAPAIEDAKSPF